MSWKSEVPSEINSIPSAPTRNPFKWVALGVGGLIAVAHIGVLGHLIKKEPPVQSAPTINLPRGPYSSYKIKAGKDGYEIEYRANDPKVLESEDLLIWIKKREVYLVVELKNAQSIVVTSTPWKAPVIWGQEVP